MSTPLELFTLKNKVAMVTGATGYLGHEMVKALAEQGAKVIIHGRDESKVSNLYQNCKDAGLECEKAIFDLNNEKEIEKYFKSFAHKRLNILVNNAYTGKAGSLETAAANDFQASYQIAVTSAAMMMKYALPFMKASAEESSSIINIASMYGMVSPDFTLYDKEESFNPPFYGAAKAALIQLTKYAAANLAKYNIRVNAISPGAFPGPEAQKNKTLMDGINRNNLLGRHGSAVELKGPLVLLASQASSYMTGTNIVVDGGWTST